MSRDDDAQPSAPITGLSHVQLVVADVSADAKWYSARCSVSSPSPTIPTSVTSRSSTGAGSSSWC